MPDDSAAIAKCSVRAARFEHDAMRRLHDCGQPDDVEGTARWIADVFRLPDAERVVAVAEDQTEIVGFAFGNRLELRPELADFRGELLALGVAPERHRGGIGTRLVQFVRDGLRERGLSPVAVWTWAGSSSVHFYEKLAAFGPLAHRGQPCSKNRGPFEQVAYGWRED